MQKEIVSEFEYFSSKYRVTIVPKNVITVHTIHWDGKVTVFDYRIGDMAEYDSYNLHYFGPIKSITEKTVTIEMIGGKNKRLKIADFAWRNSKSVAEKQSRNSDTMMYI